MAHSWAKKCTNLGPNYHYHHFGDMSNNSGQKAKIEGKNEQIFGAFTTVSEWVNVNELSKREKADLSAQPVVFAST